MTRDEAINKWIIPAIKNTWNEKKCNEILKALEQEPCEDTISRQAVNDLQKYRYNCGDTAITCVSLNSINELQSVTPHPKMGQWEWKPHPILPYTGNWYCSECNLIGQSVYSYCPNCGAKMQEVEE